MKKTAFYGIITSMTLLSLYTNGYSASMEQAKPMVPTTAIVSKQNATILAKESVRIDKGVFSVVVPSSFVQDSFILQTDGMDVMTTEVSLTPIQVKNIPLVQTRLDLVKKIEQLTTKISAIDARIQVLSSSQQVFTSAKDISTLDAALGNRFEYLYNQKNTLKQQQDALKKELKTVEQNLVASAGSVDPSYVLLTVSLVDKTMSGDYPISYSYIVNSVGWRPIYQVEADITKKTVKAKFNVELWQRTAFTWTGTTVVLTTATPSSSPEPSFLPPWNVNINKPRQEAQVMAVNSGIQTLELRAPDAPLVERISNAMQWTLGKQNITAGETKVITISTTSFDAEFKHTLRPYVSNEAFFTAHLKHNKQATLPQGNASFSVGGIGVGQGTFSYIPNDDNVVYFGKDPLVTGTMEIQKDSLVVNKKEQVKSYEWSIKVQNRRKQNVHVVVQDVKPETTSPQIAISLEGTSPQPQVTAQFVEWDIPSLRPQKVESIQYNVTMTAPLDVEIISPR